MTDARLPTPAASDFAFECRQMQVGEREWTVFEKAADTRAPDATVVVWLPGVGVHAASLEPFLRHLPQRVLFLDWAASFGAPMSAHAMMEAIVDFLAHVAPGRHVLIGHDIGCFLAALLASNHAEFVQKLVLIAPPLSKPASGATRAGLLPVVGPLLRAFVGDSVAKTHAGEGAPTPSQWALLREVRRRSLLEVRLPRLQVPVLFLVGHHDALCSPHDASRLARSMPAASLVTLDAGHAPHVDRPREVAAALARFCAAST
jgi:pimeloyl-ACP methyl ester carboxylesterase